MSPRVRVLYIADRKWYNDRTESHDTHWQEDSWHEKVRFRANTSGDIRHKETRTTKHPFERIVLDGLTLNFPFRTHISRYFHGDRLSPAAFEGRSHRSYDSGFCTIGHFPR
jgi:hypothetical protein